VLILKIKKYIILIEKHQYIPNTEIKKKGFYTGQPFIIVDCNHFLPLRLMKLNKILKRKLKNPNIWPKKKQKQL